MGLIRQGQSCLGSYRNTYVRGIYLICIRSRVGISVRARDWGLACVRVRVGITVRVISRTVTSIKIMS